MTSLPYHVLYENGQKKSLPVRQGPLLVLRTFKDNGPPTVPQQVRVIAFEASALAGKAVCVGYYKSSATRSARINLANVEPRGRNDGESHELRLTLPPNGVELHVEKMSLKPTTITQYGQWAGINGLRTVPYELGRRTLQPGERVNLNGLTPNVMHTLEWTDAETHHENERMARHLRSEGPERRRKG